MTDYAENGAQFQTYFASFLQQAALAANTWETLRLYRETIRPVYETMQATDALALVLRVQRALPPQGGALYAAALGDEGAQHMRMGAYPHACSVLQDACRMSSACRDAQAMVENTLLLARCCAAVQDEASAQRSAALCVGMINRHFGGVHPLYAQAQAFAHDPIAALREMDASRQGDDPHDEAEESAAQDDGDAPQEQQDAQAQDQNQSRQGDAHAQLVMTDGARVGFAQKGATGGARPDAALLVAAQSGLLQADSPLAHMLDEQLALWRQQGEHEQALLFLSRLEQALPEHSDYRNHTALYTARALADAGDDARAIGLYSRLVERMLDERGVHDERTLDAMRSLCALYQNAGQSAREAKMRGVVFAAVRADEGADPCADALCYLRALCLYKEDMQSLETMALWCLSHCEWDEALRELARDAALTAFADGAEETGRHICGALYENCGKKGGKFAAELMTPWVIAAAKSGVTELVLRLTLVFADTLRKSDDAQLCAAICEAADALWAQGRAEDAAKIYAICIDLCMRTGDKQQETDVAMRLAQIAQDDGRLKEAEQIRRAYGFGTQEPEQQQDDEDETQAPSEQEDASGRAQETQPPLETEQPQQDDAQAQPSPEPYDAVRAAQMRDEAVACEKQGDLARALELRTRVYDMRLAHLGATHPDTLAAMNNLAKSLLKTGDAQGAVRMYTQAAQGYEAVLGEEHAYTRTAYSNLARALERAGMHQQSFAIWQRVYAMRAAHFGPTHPQTLDAVQSMERAAQKASGKNVN